MTSSGNTPELPFDSDRSAGGHTAFNVSRSDYDALFDAAIESGPVKPETDIMQMFEDCLLDNIRDGIIFVDSQTAILKWSQSIEVLTGTSQTRVQGKSISPELLNLHDSLGKPVADFECPFLECIRTGKHIKREYTVVGRSGREVKTFFTVAPVKKDGITYGAVALVQDLSVQSDLQRQLRDLYAISMLDPLTQVANRAEFERMLDEYVQAHATTGFPCSLIICDIDFFKNINDNHGHHIGDQALVAFAQLLKKFVRQQDVVARYGGEEFVILCANCNRAAAVERAEEIRVTLTRTPQQMLNGKCITASFGVSELRSDDKAEDLFVRADQALLNAKESGRNRVVSANRVDNSTKMTEAEATSVSGVPWRKLKGEYIDSTEFVTATPMPVFVEKLRGYVIEVNATEVTGGDGYAEAVVPVEQGTEVGEFQVEFDFQEGEYTSTEPGSKKKTVTFIRVSVCQLKSGWFTRKKSPETLVPVLMSEFRRFMMLNDEGSKLAVDPHATKSTRGN